MRPQCWFNMVALGFLCIRRQSNALVTSDQYLLDAPWPGSKSSPLPEHTLQCLSLNARIQMPIPLPLLLGAVTDPLVDEGRGSMPFERRRR